MKTKYFFTVVSSFMFFEASAQMALPLNVDQSVFEADTVFIEKTRVSWDTSENCIRTENFQDGGYTVFEFKDTPGMLHLDYSRTRYGKNRSMLIQESADGQTYTDLYNGDPSTSWTTLNASLKKDTRYIKLYYDAKYTFGDVGSRMGYWRNISVTEPIATQLTADTVNVDLGSKATVAMSVSYSNPSGNIVVSTTDPHISFDETGSKTFTVENVAGAEGTASVNVFYDTTAEPSSIGEQNAVISVSDEGNEGYAKDYKIVALVKASVEMSETGGSMTTVVGQPVTRTFAVNYLSSVSADNISVTSSREDVVASVEPDAEKENTLNVTLTYLPQETAENVEASVDVNEAASGMTLTYALVLNAYSANYTISNVEEYNKFVEIANLGFKVDAELAGNIEFTAEEPNVQFTSFSGVFDGKYHSIKGYGVEDEAALFGNNSSFTGTVKNLAVENVSLLDTNVSALDENGNGLTVDCCYGTPSDNEASWLMNYVYMSTDKVKNSFTRVRSEEIDPATGKGIPMYLYKLNGGSLGMLNADMTTVEGAPACFSLWKLLESENSAPSVFGMKIGVDEMPSFRTVDNTISEASYFSNEPDAKAKSLYVQNGSLYDAETLAGFKFEGKSNDFLVLNENSEALGKEGVKALSQNIVTSDGKAHKIVLTDGVDYRFPAASELNEIAADSIEYSRMVALGALKHSFCLPFDATAVKVDEGVVPYYSFVLNTDEVVFDSKGQIVLQSTYNKVYSDFGMTFRAGFPFYADFLSATESTGEAVVTFIGENVALKSDMNGSGPMYAPLFGTFVSTTTSALDTDDFLTYLLKADDAESYVSLHPTEEASIAPFHVYMLIDKAVADNGNKVFTVRIEDGIVDGIGRLDSNEVENEDSAVFNIFGQRVSTMQSGCVYIKNGKKFVFMSK